MPKYNDIYIEGMRTANKKLAKIFDKLEDFLKKNIDQKITKNVINQFLKEQIKEEKSTSLFLGHNAGFGPYPKESIVCLNSEIVHAIPNDTIIKKDDLITVDLGIKYNGFCADAARTYSFTNNQKHQTLMQATKEAFFECTKVIKAGIDIYKIGEVILKTAKKYNLSPIKELTGHGIGRKMWEPPHIYQIPCEHYILKENKTVAIEPIFAFGNGKMRTLSDKWTIKTKNGELAAQYENTILITKTGCEILSIT